MSFIQGGIIAANGISGGFMVTSVQTVPIAPRPKREREDGQEYISKIEKEHISFDDVFDKVMEEDVQTPQFKNTTYGPNSIMSTFLFMSHMYN